MLPLLQHSVDPITPARSIEKPPLRGDGRENPNSCGKCFDRVEGAKTHSDPDRAARDALAALIGLGPSPVRASSLMWLLEELWVKRKTAVAAADEDDRK
ncbi:MAG: hypothetical protein Q9190_006190 [Brigantiaea leucoxantha]